MIQSCQNSILVLSSNSAPVTFERDCIRTRDTKGCNGWLCHSEGSPIYKIVKGGKYKIEFNTNITSATAGFVALALYVDGVAIPSATIIVPITTAGNYDNASFNKAISVCCKANSTITIASVPTILTGTTPTSTTTQTPTIQDANLIITRVVE